MLPRFRLTPPIVAFLCLFPVTTWQPTCLAQSSVQRPLLTQAAADVDLADDLPLAEIKTLGTTHSRYRDTKPSTATDSVPEQNLERFADRIRPLLERECIDCHGPDAQEGNLRIDTLDADLVRGQDVTWWLEVFAVLSKGEMPPPEEGDLTDQERSRIVDWLASEIQTASLIRRSEQEHSSFRRLTRYETNHLLQDLLGLPFDFAKDLPPEANSEDGFQNSSEMLHMSAQQFATYRELARNALLQATVRGERPDQLHWGVTMEAASEREWAVQEAELEKIRQQSDGSDSDAVQAEVERKLASYRQPPGRTHYKQRDDGRTAVATWRYPQAKYAWAPTSIPTTPTAPAPSNVVAVIPPRQKLVVELGDRIPERGTLRVRVRASKTSPEPSPFPSLQLEFGWQASNDSHASLRISDHDLLVEATPDDPQFYQWEIPLSEIYPRNLVRHVNQLGDLPNPSEYIRLVNSSVSQSALQLDYVEVVAPVYQQWPPESHRRIFFDRDSQDSDSQEVEAAYAREILSRFMERAWRRPVGEPEVERKLALFDRLRPQCEDFQHAIIEVLTTVLSSPQFLYVGQMPGDDARHAQYGLASRMALFLWCGLPDQQLLTLAAQGRLAEPDVLAQQVRRMLADERSRRFAEQFVRQWLGLQLLDYLQVDRSAHPQFDPALKESMQEEPVAFFHELLRRDESVIDFLHADFAIVNERLARHYGIPDVSGNHFRRVSFPPETRRGGLLTQAGILAMNSDGKDSHPLKRGVWLLERVLNDPPPPPPPAVPKIDVADPEIAKLTLKQRIERHRDQAACRSCHMKIDPWGIAFENFDAIGRWRTEVDGVPVDAKSVLFNQKELDGIDGLKRYLLTQRQDQFAGALVHKLMTYAIGRPLTFSDHAEVDRVTAQLRRQGDGLATLITLIVQSDLFQAK